MEFLSHLERCDRVSRYTTNFPATVERWRGLVLNSLHDVVDPSATYLHVMDKVKLTFDDLTDLVLGIIKKESSGNPDAVGDNGNSLGLMQLNFGAGTPQGLGFDGIKEDLLDPNTNVFYGCLYFLKQLNRYKETVDPVASALSAYNAGTQTSKNLSTYVNPILGYLSEKKT